MDATKTKPLSWNDLHPDVPFEYGLTSLEHAYSQGQFSDKGEVDLTHVVLGLYILHSQNRWDRVSYWYDDYYHTDCNQVIIEKDSFPAVTSLVKDTSVPFLDRESQDLRHLYGTTLGTFNALDDLWVSLSRQRGLEGFQLLEAASSSTNFSGERRVPLEHNMVLARDFCAGLKGWDSLDSIGQNVLKLILLYYLKGSAYYPSFKSALLRIERIRTAFSMKKWGNKCDPAKCLAALLPNFGHESMEDWHDLKVCTINPWW